jgi:uridylate kinase
MSSPKYKRVVLKLSGEALAGDSGFGINPSVIKSIAGQVKEIAELGVEVAVVVGGGNIWRGKIGSEMGMDIHCRLHGNACNRNEFIIITR